MTFLLSKQTFKPLDFDEKVQASVFNNSNREELPLAAKPATLATVCLDHCFLFKNKFSTAMFDIYCIL